MLNKTIYTASISSLLLCASVFAETTPTATFAFFDANADGSLDHKEYKNGIYAVARQIMLDRGDDKSQAHTEALKLKKLAVAEFQELDTDDSKSVNKAEFEVLHSAQDEAAEAFDFAAADIDNDGFLTGKEYKEFVGRAAQEKAIAGGTDKKDTYELFKQAKKAAFEHFKELDVDKNHKLSPDEL